MSAQRSVMVGASAAAGLGLVAAGVTSELPWNDTDFRLGPVIRMIMAAAGAAILVLAARTDSRLRGLRVALLLLGGSVLIYPTALSLTAAGLGGPGVGALAMGGHVLPLVLVQVLPVLATHLVSGRSRRGWLALIICVAVVGLVITILALQAVAGSAVLGVLSSTLWLGSFVLAPIASWTGVPGTTGETRRRAVVAGLASVVPVVIIALCLALGVAAETQGISQNAAVTALMGGFSASTLGSALLVSAATGSEESLLLRRRVVVGVLQGLLVAATVLIAIGGALVVFQAGLGASGTALIGILIAVIIGLGAVRLFGWAARAVDPAADLAEQVAALGEIPDGEHRQSLQQVLRRVLGDAGLLLVVRASDGTWVDATGVEPSQLPVDAVPLARSGSEPTAVATGLLLRSQARIARLGDLGILLRPAVLEATVQRESQRADAAAEGERQRLRQDLHDGLQGRLLGIAFNLQLSGQQVDDPTTRLLVEQTVASLRDAVEDVRALAGGRLPATLVDEGLRPALADLVRPLAPVVELDVPDTRFAPEIEAVSYFVVGEAISNAIKHGQPDRVHVLLEAAADRVTIMVTDDGSGDADPRLGSGLRGLAERVAASGGVLVVRDAAPHGTVVEASLPCGS